MPINEYITEGVAEYVLTLFPTEFKGVCVDIGACHPMWISNSYLLETNGWDCYCIEPNPIWIPSLKEHRKNVLQYACGNENGTGPLFVFQANEEILEAAGTSLINHCEHDIKKIDRDNHKKIFVGIKQVEIRTLDWLMENEIKQNHIDFLSIDVERCEKLVLDGCDLNRWNPKVIVIENFGEQWQYDYFKQFGYKKIHRIVYNDFYIKE